MIELVSVYLCVKDMDRAIKFYEELLGMKIKHRYKNRWADFEEKGFSLGLYKPEFDGEKYEIGSNAVPNFYTDEINKEHDRIKKLNPKNIGTIESVNFMFPYKYFMVEDPEGNLLEIAQWNRD